LRLIHAQNCRNTDENILSQSLINVYFCLFFPPFLKKRTAIPMAMAVCRLKRDSSMADHSFHPQIERRVLRQKCLQLQTGN
jgi:hypothetical protein